MDIYQLISYNNAKIYPYYSLKMIKNNIYFWKMIKNVVNLYYQNKCLKSFSSSNYLRSRIHFELGDKSKYKLTVITTKRPNLAVVDGAVRLGLKPEYIKERRCAKTYGIKVNGLKKKKIFF